MKKAAALLIVLVISTVNVPIIGEDLTFSDVPEEHWAYEAVTALTAEGIINGKGEGRFEPNASITRAEFTKIMVGLFPEIGVDADTNAYSDVTEDMWSYAYVLKGQQMGLFNDSGKFYPDDPITRQDMFTMTYRLLTIYYTDRLGLRIVSSTSLDDKGVTDADSIPEYAKIPIATLIEQGLISGYTDGTIRPSLSLTRAEATKVIYKIYSNFKRNKEEIDSADREETAGEATSDFRSAIGRYQLNESNSQMTLWTDYPSEKVFQNEPIPQEKGSGIHVYMAKNEFEPFQLVIKPESNTSVTLSYDAMPTGLTAEAYQVYYVDLETATDQLGDTGQYPDPLYPIEFETSIPIKAHQNTAFWINLETENTITAGKKSFTIYINDTAVPINVYVYDFEIPEELHVKSQINISTSTVLEKYGVEGTGEAYWQYVDAFKQFMIDHRLTPKSALWSGGLTSNGGSPYIDYDSTAGTFTDPHGIWGFEYPADRYLAGKQNFVNAYLSDTPFNGGVGFPTFMAMTFRNNDASADQRPSIFEGITRQSTDWYEADNINTAYNQKWFQYIGDIEDYLREKGYLDQAYYYFANEPQDTADYDAVSWYASQLKEAAPDLKLMVSEEPKPEIYNNIKYPGAKIDQWLAVLNLYDPEISWEREENYGEETWIYFLHGTKPPYFNPITLDHPGIESKLTGWFLWKYRIKGIAHYSFNDWSTNVWEETMTSGHNGDDFMLYPPSLNNTPIEYGATNHRFVTSIRFELMRDSLEDYEYLYLLNNGDQPQVNRSNSSDQSVDKIIYGLTSYNRDSQYIYTLRQYLGAMIEGSVAQLPEIESGHVSERSQTSKTAYYINFQDPTGDPVDAPLQVDGKTYIKIGWTDYNSDLGYGWYGDMSHVMYRYLDNAPNPLQGSVLYDDWGRQKTFEFDLPNGTYDVTVSCGWQGRDYGHNHISVEGISFIDDEATQPYLVRTKTVTVSDQKLTMEMGIFDEYTMLNYMEIVPH